MMILRLIAYFLILFLFTSMLSLSAVVWSFYESVNSSFNLIVYSSDNKARDILATVAKVAETKMNPDGFAEMKDFFHRIVKQSEKDLDHFTIKEVFLISNSGKLLAHNDPKEMAALDASNQKYDKPYFTRALRMRKGQLPTPQVFGKDEFKKEEGFFNNQILKIFPKLKDQQILLSAPIYQTEKLQTIGTIHLIYNRGNVLFFIQNQKAIFAWMVWNFIGLSFITSIVLFGFYCIFIFGAYKQAARKTANIPEPKLSKTMSKIQSYVENHEERISRFLSPIPIQMENTIFDAVSLKDDDNDFIHPENISSANFNRIDLNIEEPTKDKNPNATDAVDAILLD